MQNFENLNMLEEIFVKEHVNQIKAFLELAVKGDPEAELQLGTLYWENNPSERFQEEAIRLITLSIEHGNPRAAEYLRQISSEDDSEDDSTPDYPSPDYQKMIVSDFTHADTKEYFDHFQPKRIPVRQSRLNLEYELGAFVFLIASMGAYGFYKYSHTAISYAIFCVAAIFAVFIIYPSFTKRTIEISEAGVRVLKKSGDDYCISRKQLLQIRINKRQLILSEENHTRVFWIQRTIDDTELSAINLLIESFMHSYPQSYYTDMGVLDVRRIIESASEVFINSKKLAINLILHLQTDERINIIIYQTIIWRFRLLLVIYLLVASFIIRGYVIALTFYHVDKYLSKRFYICTNTRLFEARGTYGVTNIILGKDIIDVSLDERGFLIRTNDGDTFIKCSLKYKYRRRAIKKALQELIDNN